MVKANDEKSDKPINLQQGGGSTFSTHIFPETQFMGVTAYQNQQVRFGLSCVWSTYNTATDMLTATACALHLV